MFGWLKWLWKRKPEDDLELYYSAQVWTIGFPGPTRCVYRMAFRDKDKARFYAKLAAKRVDYLGLVCKECGIMWRVIDLREMEWWEWPEEKREIQKADQE